MTDYDENMADKIIRVADAFQELDDAITDLLLKKIISADDAYLRAYDKAKFLPYLKHPPSDFTEV